MKAIIPENFDLEEHIIDYPPNYYGISTFNRDHALYCLSQIIIAPAQDQELFDNMDTAENFTPLYSNRLQDHVHDYRKYFDYFIQTFVIESDNYYIRKVDQPGKEKSIGYRFCLSYASADLKVLDYSKNFSNVLKRKERSKFNSLKDYNHLLRFLWPKCQLTIDFQLASKASRQKRDTLLRYPQLREKKYNNRKRKIEIKNPIVQYTSNKANITALHMSYSHFTVDERGKRLHTALTNMASRNRHFLTCKGQYLISIDIKNSQPYFITSLFRKEMYINSKKTINLHTICKELYSAVEPVLFPDGFSAENGFFDKFTNEDILLYKSLVSNVDGNPTDLYLYMQDEFFKLGKEYKERDDVKQVVIEILYTANRYSTEAKKCFQQLFPTIDNLLRKFKQNDKADLPCILQCIESHMILLVITKRFARKYPKAPIFTIHDSIATTEPYAESLKIIMEEELTKFTGLPPKLKEDRWRPDKFDWNEYVIEAKDKSE